MIKNKYDFSFSEFVIIFNMLAILITIAFISVTGCITEELEEDIKLKNKTLLFTNNKRCEDNVK